MFSKKAKKIDEIFTVDLTLWSKWSKMVKISSIFVAFLENTNFKTNLQILLWDQRLLLVLAVLCGFEPHPEVPVEPQK